MKTKYHTFENHVKPMLNQIDNDLHLNGNGGKEKKLILSLAAIFHDIIYNPVSKTNEEDSVNIFKAYCDSNFDIFCDEICNSTMMKYGYIHTYNDIIEIENKYNVREFLNPIVQKKVIELILNTKDTFNDRKGDELGHYFYLMDTYILRESFDKLIQYEHQIYNEFKNYYTLEQYKKGRIDFLQSCIEKVQNANVVGLEKLIDYIKNRDYGTVGIFVGSFNPFHIGHLNVLKQAKKDFTNIIVVQMQDFNKPKNQYKIPDIDMLNCYTTTSDKLLSEVYEEYKQGYNNATIIRALRNGDDLQYEQNLRSTVKDFNIDVRFTYYLSDIQYSHISSTLVRSLPDNIKPKYLVYEKV